MTDFQGRVDRESHIYDAPEARGADSREETKSPMPPARKSAARRRRAAEVEQTTESHTPHGEEIAGHHVVESRMADAGNGGGLKLCAGQSRPAPSDPITGHNATANPSGTAGSDAGLRRIGRQRISARVADIGGGLTPLGDQFHDAPSEPIAGRVLNETQAHHAGDGEGQGFVADRLAAALPELCDAIRALQRKRRFCIVSQSRIDRACEAFITQQLSPTGEADPAKRKALWAQAGKLRREVEAGGGGQNLRDAQTWGALSSCRDVILQSAAARQAWDTMRRAAEAEMRRLAKRLPVYPWAKGIAGFGDLGIAIVCAEAGDLSIYATKEKVWKRLGLAVIDGFRQQRRSDAELAARHGFSPPRRAEIWTIADSMFKHQWRGEKEGVPAHPTGPYGEVYARRKAHTEGREWTNAHRDNDARRIMTKFLVENYWRVWRGLPPLTPQQNNEPRTDAAQVADGERATQRLAINDDMPAPNQSGADASGDRAMSTSETDKPAPDLETPGRAAVAPTAECGSPVPEVA